MGAPVPPGVYWSLMRSPQLQNAIEQVYAEFRGPKPSKIEGCPCCTDPKELCMLLSKGLRDLTYEELRDYGMSAFLTMGAERDFEYLLPRLLETAAVEDPFPSLEILLGKLTLAGWQTWPHRRRAAVVQFFDAWFTELLNAEPPHGGWIDDLLCGIGAAELPLRPYLDMLAAKPDALRAFFEVNSHAFFKRRGLADASWSDHKSAAAEVIDFLNLPTTRSKLGL
jgi:hypothetical protein